jgi:hypothetical protein
VGVLDHPELGSTLTEPNGIFALAVNGGGLVTLVYSKAGLISGQRQVQTQWHQMYWAPDIELIAHDDGPGTLVAPGSIMTQVARGRVISAAEDVSGTRQATLIIPPGTTATNFTSPTGTWTVHLTEFTVGAGPRRMPADLPPTSGYTYAFEASIDEATAVGAKRVDFNQPIPFYVENFLNFTSGTTVPLGYFDAERGVWVGETSGRIAKIVSITAGRANLDVNGDNFPDTGALLTTLGITDAERQQVASLYPVGKTLWRAQLKHFTPWDCNWGGVPPSYARPPTAPKPIQPPDLPGDCKSPWASSISCQSQSLEEDVPIVGTPLSLHYTSARAEPGQRQIRINLVGPDGFAAAEVPNAIEWELQIAGRILTGRSTAFSPSSFVDVAWDGLDGFGNSVLGDVQATLKIGNAYPALASVTSQFAEMADPGVLVGNARGEIVVTRTHSFEVRHVNTKAQGFGGWTVNINHVLSREFGQLILGSGRTPERLRGATVDTIAGKLGVPQNFLGDNGPALGETIASSSLVVGADGTIYIAAGSSNPLRSIRTDGIIRKIGNRGFTRTIDGIDAASAIITANDLAISPSGELHFVDFPQAQIWRVTNEAIPKVRLVAGVGLTCFDFVNGCNGRRLAKEALLTNPHGIAFDATGMLYFADQGYNSLGGIGRVRRIAPDGFISDAAIVPYPQQISALANGDLWVRGGLDGRGLYRVSTSGKVTREYADVNSQLCNSTVDWGFSSPFVSSSGRVGFTCANKILQLADNGTQIIAGSSSPSNVGYTGDKGPATLATFSQTHLAAFEPDGKTIVVADQGGGILRRLPRVPGVSSTNGKFMFPSDTGSELYEFGPDGKHLATRTALTGALRYQFSYNALGALISIVDEEGLLTRIDRNPLGQATRIVGPHNQVTELTMDANGFLSSIKSPNDEAWTFSNSSEGLIANTVDPRNGTRVYSYDARGLLATDEDAEGKRVSLVRTATPTGWNVAKISPEGRTTGYTVNFDALNEDERSVTKPGGSVSRQTRTVSETRPTTLSNGTTLSLERSSDPRYGLIAPLQTTEQTAPSGLKMRVAQSRVSTVSDANDPTSLTADTLTTSTNAASCSTGASCVQIASTRVYSKASNSIVTTSPAGRSESVVIDAKERPILRSVPGIAAIATSYDLEGRVLRVLQGARAIDMQYGADGWLSQVTDPLGRTASCVFRLTRSPIPISRDREEVMMRRC